MDLNIDYSKEILANKIFKKDISYLKNCHKKVYIYGLSDNIITDSIQKTLYDNGIVSTFIDALDTALLKQVVMGGNCVIIFACDFVGFSDKFHKSFNYLLKMCNDESIDIVLPDGHWTREIDVGELIPQWTGITSQYIKENYQLFNQTYNLLCDDFSRLLMKDYLYSQITLDGTNLEKYWLNKTMDYDYDLLLQGNKSNYDILNNIIIECGAFDGKSIIEMANYINVPINMVAMECDDINYQKLCKNIKNYSNIKPYKFAVWNKPAKFAVMHNGSASYLKEVTGPFKGQVIDAINIDSMVEKENNKYISALLIDIEGSEMKALEGAKIQLARKKTNIAIRVYHKKEDLITIPQYLYSINNNYKFYLRYNHQMKARNGHETTLYAIAWT